MGKEIVKRHSGIQHACATCCSGSENESPVDSEESGAECAVQALTSLSSLGPWSPTTLDVDVSKSKGAQEFVRRVQDARRRQRERVEREHVRREKSGGPGSQLSGSEECERQLACAACVGCAVAGVIGCHVWCAFDGDDPGCVDRCMQRVGGAAFLRTEEAEYGAGELWDVGVGVIVRGCRLACTRCRGSGTGNTRQNG
jgi:hypothetical protein